MWWTAMSYCLYVAVIPVDTGTLRIELSGIREPKGIIWVGLYDSQASFMVKEKAIVKGFEVVATGTMTLTISSLAAGRWAVAIFHDINGNGELDTNYLGVPTEPYAFSKKPLSKWRMPRYEEIAIPFHPPVQYLHVQLESWHL